MVWKERELTYMTCNARVEVQGNLFSVDCWVDVEEMATIIPEQIFSEIEEKNSPR